MRKVFCILTVALMIVSLAACGNSAKPANDATAAVSETQAADPATESARTAVPSADGVDIDLTAMSGTMVYSEVLNMQQKPDEYYGKIVRMKGPFNVTETKDNRYFACVVKDATACCSTGIEFEWAGDHSYPEDYPKPDTEITVTGEFTTYTEGNSKYLQLKNAEVQF